jgi:hypothetical protein
MKTIQTELGATNNWYTNTKKAKEQGLESCAHCGKGMAEGTGFLVRTIIEKELVIPFDATEGEIVRIGKACIKNFAFETLPATHYKKASE